MHGVLPFKAKCQEASVLVGFQVATCHQSWAHTKGGAYLFIAVPFARRMHFPDKQILEGSLLSNLHERIR